MLANIKAILELIKMIVATWKWAKGQIDDLTYKREVARIEEQVEKYKSGSKEERLRALEELGK